LKRRPSTGDQISAADRELLALSTDGSSSCARCTEYKRAEDPLLDPARESSSIVELQAATPGRSRPGRRELSATCST
jgi:chorismate mutase